MSIIDNLFKYIYIDAVAVGQVLVTITAASVSLIAIKKDLRSKTIALQNEARTTKYIIYVLATVSLINIFVSSYQSHIDKSDLNRNIDSLKVENNKLRRDLGNKLVQQIDRTITNQNVSTDKLIAAANNLKETVNGSLKVPLFYFVTIGDTILTGTIYNPDSKPVYNLSFKIINYDNVLDCNKVNLLGYPYFDLNCFTNNSVQLPPIISLNSLGRQYINLPKFNSKIKTGRFFIYVTLRNKPYVEEAIYSISKNGDMAQALRIIELKNDKLSSSLIIRDSFYQLKNVNWNKEFPLPLIFRLRKL